jgi:hypothetical protein
VADHVEPHNGDVNKFFLGALQSLCQPCHDRHKKREELWGYRCDVDADGWPVDPRHPSNRLRQAKPSQAKPSQAKPSQAKPSQAS